MLTRREWRGIDRPFLLTALLLLGLGFLALYSASFQKSQAMGVSFIQRQFTWAAIGFGLAVVLVTVDYHRWLEWAYFLYAVNLLLLFLVLELGLVRGGAQRWLGVAGFTVQPSEFSKITTILALARYLGSRRDAPLSAGQAAGVFGMIALPMGLILAEPNLGTATIFLPIALAMLLIWGIRLRVLGFFLVIALGAIPFGWRMLADYQRSRLMVFLNPNLDPLGAGYTVIQSKIAIGSGGLLGKGWLAGTQNQLNFLPERHTDFIFSVVGEEWGFAGASVVLGLFAFLLYRGIRIASQTRDPFGRLLAVGIVTMLFSHGVVNAGMTMGFMPVVGLPLPLFSYGGSWLLVCLASIGMVLSVAARRPGF